MASRRSGTPLDSSFIPPALNDWVFDATEVTGERYLVTGNFTDVDSDPSTDYILRLKSDGSRDASFQPPILDKWATNAIEDSNGDYIIAGAFTNAGGRIGPSYLARLYGEPTG